MGLLKTLSAVLFLLLAMSGVALADSVSYTGTFANSTDTFILGFNVAGTTNQSVTFQTWGFGGGVNAAGQTITPGGFDPFLGVFSGTGPTAAILTDGSGNAFGVSDVLSNFASFVGCPPAGTVDIGGSVCGDITMTLSLAPGTYTMLLSDGAYIPNAVFDNGTLGEGFSDFTGGAFQTCNSTDSGTTCANDTGDWAIDITSSGGGSVTPTPEPASILLVAGGLCGMGFSWKRKLSQSKSNA